MAGIPCAAQDCPEDAQVGVMVYGAEGGTTDLCALHLAQWALDIAQGAYGPLSPERGPETAATAPEGGEGTEDAPAPRRRRRGQATAQQGQESPAPEGAEVQGAEH